MSRRVCVVTGSRADYGHLAPVMSAIDNHPKLALQTVVTGQHLDSRYGSTWSVIEDDGFAVDDKVDLSLGTDTPLETAQAVGRGVGALAESFQRLQPDVIVVLGDRFEILAAAQSALLLNIPVAHIHGGEATEAAVDDAIRHAITKMARLHFCAAESYAARVRQMGENPEHVFTVGAPGLDPLETMTFLSRGALAKQVGIDLSGALFVITYHPVTLKLADGSTAVDALINALNQFDDVAMVFTGVNSDPGNQVIREAIDGFVSKDKTRRAVVASLGQQRYLSAVREAEMVIGNSSSGLIEAPALGIPTINIGDRQKGRLRCPSVIDCADQTEAIVDAIRHARDAAFQEHAKSVKPPYGRGGASAKIAAILADIDLAQLSTKPFHDIIP